MYGYITAITLLHHLWQFYDIIFGVIFSFNLIRGKVMGPLLSHYLIN